MKKDGMKTIAKLDLIMTRFKSILGQIPGTIALRDEAHISPITSSK